MKIEYKELFNVVSAEDGHWLVDRTNKICTKSAICPKSVNESNCGFEEVSEEVDFSSVEDEDNTFELDGARATKIAEIDAYDVSENVNSFIYQGASFWLDKETRVGLVNSTNMLKASGHEETTLWLGDVCVTLQCDQVLQMLCALECYALECYNTTARHKAEVKALKSVSDVEQYDITQGYPTKLAF